MKARFRELLRANPFVPFVIRMADGNESRIDHPDFVLAASSNVPQVIVENAEGEVSFLSILLMTSIQLVGTPQPQTA